MALKKEKKRKEKRGEILMTQSYKMEDAHKLELQLDKHNVTKIFMKSHHWICFETLCIAKWVCKKEIWVEMGWVAYAINQ